MRKFKYSMTAMIALSLTSLIHAQEDVAQHLQDISVTIRAANSEGSGVLITRELQLKKGDKDKVKVNFVVTCAHVVDGLRSTRIIIDSKGQKKTIIEFRNAQIIKELVEGGRKVGELTMEAKVILYSDSEDGEDLAVLIVLKRGFVDTNTKFFLDKKPVSIGTQWFHVGSLLGQSGAKSMTTGIMSKIGRVFNLGNGDGTVFDQTTVTAFPGSSGGGVFLTDGQYIGMLVRGSGETFNFIVPIRRMVSWADDRDVEWVLDPSVDMPTLQDILTIKPEDEAGGSAENSTPDDGSSLIKKFPFLIINQKIPALK